MGKAVFSLQLDLNLGLCDVGDDTLPLSYMYQAREKELNSIQYILFMPTIGKSIFTSQVAHQRLTARFLQDEATGNIATPPWMGS